MREAVYCFVLHVFPFRKQQTLQSIPNKGLVCIFVRQPLDVVKKSGFCIFILKSSTSLASNVSRSSRSSRHLYRKGSLSSLSLHSDLEAGFPLQAMGDGVANGSIGGRKRTPSGKSIRSRKVSTAEYHLDLKGDLSQVKNFLPFTSTFMAKVFGGNCCLTSDKKNKLTVPFQSIMSPTQPGMHQAAC